MIHLFENNPYTLKMSPQMESARKIVSRDIKKIIHKPYHEIIYSISKYETITTKRNCGGYFDRYRNQIALNANQKDLYSTVFHELGHFIHSENGYDFEGDNTISHSIIMEQEVESFALKIYKDIFGIYKPKEEWSYYNKQDAEFLANWYGDYKVNDIIAI